MTRGSRIEAATTYAGLLALRQPRTIMSLAEADAVQEQIDALLDQDVLTDAEWQYLSLLGDLVMVWESDRYDLSDIHGTEAIHELMRVHSVRQIDLVGPVFPTRSVASAVLSGKRPLSYETVRKLSVFFHVPADVFFPKGEGATEGG